MQTGHSLNDAILQKPLADCPNIFLGSVARRLKSKSEQCHILSKPLLVVFSLRGTRDVSEWKRGSSVGYPYCTAAAIFTDLLPASDHPLSHGFVQPDMNLLSVPFQPMSNEMDAHALLVGRERLRFVRGKDGNRELRPL